jgi:hypothetical protein
MRRTGRAKIVTESPMYDRLARARVGMSVSQLLGRGLTRRDLRIAIRRGWMTIEGEQP